MNYDQPFVTENADTSCFVRFLLQRKDMKIIVLSVCGRPL